MAAKVTNAQKRFLIEASEPAGKTVRHENRTAYVLEQLGMIVAEALIEHPGRYLVMWRPTSKGYAAINDPGGPAVTIQSISASCQ